MAYDKKTKKTGKTAKIYVPYKKLKGGSSAYLLLIII